MALPVLVALVIVVTYAYPPEHVVDEALRRMWAGETQRSSYCDNMIKDNLYDTITAARLLDDVFTRAFRLMTAPDVQVSRRITVSVLYAVAPHPDQHEFVMMKYLGISNFGRNCINRLIAAKAPEGNDLRSHYDSVILRLSNEFGILLEGCASNSSRIMQVGNIQAETIRRAGIVPPWSHYMDRFAHNSLKQCRIFHGVVGACSEDFADFVAHVAGLSPFLISTVDVSGPIHQRVITTRPQCAKCHCSRLRSRRSITDYIPRQVVYTRASSFNASYELPVHRPHSESDIYLCWKHLGVADHILSHPPERDVCPGCVQLGRRMCSWTPNCI